ncbi:ATP-binding protein [Novosphingobium sp.]|uniref:ATP-binding protein n=1 Tax=Novosphingobium sp. TaxID=1874826 RepID=UPI0035B090A7
MTWRTPLSGLARTSLRTRLSLAVLAWTLLGITAIWLSATRLFAAHVEEHFNDELMVHVQELSRLTRIGADGRPELIRPLSDPRYEVPLSGYYWQVSVNGKPPLKSASMTRGSLDARIAHSNTILHSNTAGPTGDAIVYGMVRRDPSGPELHFVIATDHSELEALVGHFTRELSLWLALLAAGLLGAGAAMARLTLRPLGRLSQAIARLEQGRAERLEGDYPSEIRPLVEGLNAFVRSTAEAVARSRVEAGNLAHSLRTPLAVITDEAEQLARADATHEAAQVLLQQASTMQLQIDYQLARARSSNRAGLPGAASNLPDMLPAIINAIGRLHPGKTFRIENQLTAAQTVPLDPVDLLEVLSNLLDNAGKWARTAVTLGLAETDRTIELTVTDDGPGLDPAQIEQAFGIGVRFDTAMPGSGLGLAIARNISEGMGARLTLGGRADGKSGLSARLEVPRAARA